MQKDKIRKYHSSTFKAKVALEAIKENKTVNELSVEFGVKAKQIYAWRDSLLKDVATIFTDKRSAKNKISILLCALLLFSVTHQAQGMLNKVAKFLVRSRPAKQHIQKEVMLYAQAMGLESPEEYETLQVYHSLAMSSYICWNHTTGAYVRTINAEELEKENDQLIKDICSLTKNGIYLTKFRTFFPSKRQRTIAHEVGHATDDIMGTLNESDRFKGEYRANKKATIALYKVGHYRTLYKVLKIKTSNPKNNSPHAYGAVSGFLSLLEKHPTCETLKKIQKKLEHKENWHTWVVKVKIKRSELQQYDKNLFPNETYNDEKNDDL